MGVKDLTKKIRVTVKDVCRILIILAVLGWMVWGMILFYGR